MKCYSIQQNKLIQTIRPLPFVGNDQVLVQIKAIGINRADILQIEGKYPAPDGSDIPGLEFSGIITNTSERVCGLTSSGAYSEYIAVSKSQLIKIPDSLSDVEAAALPEALAVAWHNLYSLGQIQLIKSVLIHGGTSGIGHLLVQFAIDQGAKVYATASDLDKLKFLQDKCYITSFDNFTKLIEKNGEVDLVIDILGGQYLNQNIKCCNFRAKIIMLASMDNRSADIDLGSLLMKNITIIGSTMRSKTTQEKAAILADAANHLLPLVLTGKVKPIISKTFSFDNILLAHNQLKSRDNIGKIVITV